MPPHRDWTRRGAGRALLYWPLVAFILAAAFPALAVPLVVGSGLTLLTLGSVGGFAGKRWRARRLARARETVPGLVEDVPSRDAERGSGAGFAATGSGNGPAASRRAPAVWPTGRHARRHRRPARPAAGRDTGAVGEPARPRAA